MIELLLAVLIVTVAFVLIERWSTGEMYIILYLKDGKQHKKTIMFWGDGTTSARDYAELYASELSPIYEVTKVNKAEG